MRQIIGFSAIFLSIVLFSCTENDSCSSLPKPKNIIIFIGDGMGYNHVLATNYYEYGEAKAQVYEQSDWIKYAMTTYSAILNTKDSDTIFAHGYSPNLAWSDPDYLVNGYTDSGAGGTAISAGKKTYDASIGMGIYGDTLKHLSQVAKDHGKSVGIVSSVPFSHATPASFIAHNQNRNNYEEITQYILFNTLADVVLGAGHPDFDNDGNPAERNSKYAGGNYLWEQILEDGVLEHFATGTDTLWVKDINGDGKPNPWRLIQKREEFVELIEATEAERVLGLARANNTLHYERTLLPGEKLPFDNPYNENVPTLTEMSMAAINVLNHNEEGFFLMVEGGAIDWASHDNISHRMIEEQIDFNNAIIAAVQWIETHSSWDETLVIITSDHECGYLTGPSHPEVINSPVKNKGKGKLPEMKWNYDHHTNQLVPFYAKGPGAELFELFADEYDPVRGPFIQNTEVAQLIFLMWR